MESELKKKQEAKPINQQARYERREVQEGRCCTEGPSASKWENDKRILRRWEQTLTWKHEQFKREIAGGQMDWERERTNT